MWKVSVSVSVRPKKGGTPGSAASARSRSARAAPRRSAAQASTPASTTAEVAARMAVRQSAACARCARSVARTGSGAVVVSLGAEDTVGGRYARSRAGRKGHMTQTMLAGRLDVRTREFAVTEVPKPSPGPGEVLIRVAAAGIRLVITHQGPA
jgi:hypothetical protein